MLSAAPDTEASGGNIVVAPEDTVPPKVEFRDRTVTDKYWGALYALFYVVYLSLGFVLVSQSKNPYTYSENGVRTGIADHYLEDVQKCCDDGLASGICFFYYDDGRRLQSGNSKFSGDEGIFDAFIEAPEIIFGLTALTLAIAFAWVLALRYFSKQVVILSELCKIALFIYFGAIQESSETSITCYVIAFFLAAYAVWAREKIMYAAKVIEQSTIAMKHNPSIFVGGILCKILFAANAAFFIFFFAESFNVVEVVKDDYNDDYNYCLFEPKGYTRPFSVVLCIGYLWTIFLLDKMRLFIIAGTVGSWHFHPDDKPSIWLSIKNIGPSFGTLSVAGLISSIADYINRIANRNQCGLWMCPFTTPLAILLCCFGTCLKSFILMLTKFSVILHVFTGQSFVGSGKSAFKILSRHFKGGFVTEVTSVSVLTLSSYGFALGISMVAWKWVDDEFDCGTLSAFKGDDRFLMWAAVVMILLNTWYPILGIYLLIFINSSLKSLNKESLNKELHTTSNNYLWIPPLAASFVGCISMIMFKFLSAIFLDTIDTMFLCFAIDKDNNVINPDNELVSIVSKVSNYIEVPTNEPGNKLNKNEFQTAIPVSE